MVMVAKIMTFFASGNSYAEVEASDFYLKAGGGTTEYDGLIDASGTCGTITATISGDDKDTGRELIAGYHVTENFSFEVGYKHLGEVSENLTLGTGVCSDYIGTITVTTAAEGKAVWETDGWTLGGEYSFPVHDYLTIDLNAGLYSFETDLDISASAGAGSLVSGGTTWTWSGGSGSATFEEDSSDLYYGIGATIYSPVNSVSGSVGFQKFESLGGDNVGGRSDVDYLYAGLTIGF